MIIRKLEEKDKEQLLQLLYELHVEFHRDELLAQSPIRSFIEYSDTNTSMQEGLTVMSDVNHLTFVVEEKYKLLGFISGKINELKGKVHNQEGEIDDWYIKQPYRNKGIGKQLYQKLVESFKEKGCTHLAITAYAENKKAIKFYQQLGFKEFGVMLKKKLD